MPPNAGHSAEAIMLAEKHLPGAWDKDKVIRWLGRITPQQIDLRPQSHHRAWRMFKEEILGVEKWMGAGKTEHAWKRYSELRKWPQWPDRSKLGAIMVIAAEKIGHFQIPETMDAALKAVNIHGRDLVRADLERTYPEYWPSAMLWVADENAMPLDRWITRFKKEFWTWDEVTKTMSPPPLLQERFGAAPVRLAPMQAVPNFPSAVTAMLELPPSSPVMPLPAHTEQKAAAQTATQLDIKPMTMAENKTVAAAPIMNSYPIPPAPPMLPMSLTAPPARHIPSHSPAFASISTLLPPKGPGLLKPHEARAAVNPLHAPTPPPVPPMKRDAPSPSPQQQASIVQRLTDIPKLKLDLQLARRDVDNLNHQVKHLQTTVWLQSTKLESLAEEVRGFRAVAEEVRVFRAVAEDAAISKQLLEEGTAQTAANNGPANAAS